MTSEQIDQLQPGLELDTLIAEKIMGFKWCVQTYGDISNIGKKDYYRYLMSPESLRVQKVKPEFWNPETEIPITNNPAFASPIPTYSIGMAVTWQIVQKIIRGWVTFELSGPYYDGWSAKFLTDGVLKNEGNGQTPELAICRAALKAVMGVKE